MISDLKYVYIKKKVENIKNDGEKYLMRKFIRIKTFNKSL